MTKDKKLRILVSTNAMWAQSGYAQQAYDLLPRIKNEGYPLAAVNFYGQEGGTFELDGIMCYPKLADAWGADALVDHSTDYKADVSFTLQDIWVLNPELLKKVKRWCLDGNTKISLANGKEIKIKDFVKEKRKDKVYGYKNGKVVKASILDWQIIPKKEVIEIKTNKSKVLITGDNEVLVNGKWIPAIDIKKGDMVYYYTNEPLSNKGAKTKKGRLGLYSRNNRWGRDNNDNEGKEKKPYKWTDKAYNSSDATYRKHEQGFIRLAWFENRNKNKFSKKTYREYIQPIIQKTYKRNKGELQHSNSWLQLFTNLKKYISIFNSKKETSRFINEIYKVKNYKTKKEIQPAIQQKRNRNVGAGPNIKPEVVLAVRKIKNSKRTVYDISTTTGNFFANKILVHNCPIVPIDHEPAPVSILSRLRLAYRIVTYSQFGYNELKRNGFHSTYIPHTVDTTIFKKGDKQAIRKRMNIPQDYFMFGMVAANKDNPPRKSFQEVMDAFAKFHKNHPKSGIYFHVMLDQQGGFPIKEYAKFLGIQEFVYHLQPYEQFLKVKRDKMHEIYNLMDCLLSPSTNEGFGVPIIEAQACETPVIVNDFTSMPELIIDGVTGYKTKVLHKRFTPLLSYVAYPDTESIYNKMEQVYKTDRAKMGFAARQYIIKNYDTETIFKEKWIPFLAKLEDEIHTNPVKAEIKIA